MVQRTILLLVVVALGWALAPSSAAAEEGVVFEGVVVVGDSQEPARRGSIDLTRTDPARPRRVVGVPIGKDGRFRAEGLEPGEWSGFVFVPYAPWPYTIVASESSAITSSGSLLTLKLDKGDSVIAARLALLPPKVLRGTVLDVDGKPLPEAQIEVAWDDALSNPAAIETDENGFFEVLVPTRQPFRGVVSVIVERHTAPRVTFDGGNRSRLPDDLVIRLSPGATVRGALRFPDGEPVVGAEVRLEPRGDRKRMATHAVKDTTTDAAGRFEVTGVPTGEWQVSVSSPAEAFEKDSVTVRVPTRGNPESIELIVDRVHRGAFRLRTPDGAPLVGTTVELARTTWAGTETSGLPGTSDDAGAVVLTASMRGPWSLHRLSQTRDRDVLVDSLTLPVTDLEVIAPALPRNELQVRALLPSGVPLQAFRVEVTWKDVSPSGSWRTRSLAAARTDAGLARVSFTGAQVVDVAVIPDPEHVEPDVRTKSVRWDATSTPELVVQLEPTSFGGSVHDEDGQPLSGWQVLLRPERGARGRLLAEVLTREDGTFAFDPERVPRRTPYVQVISPEGYQPLRPMLLEASGLPLRFVARKGRRLEGRLVIEGTDVDPSSLNASLRWDVSTSEWESMLLYPSAPLDVSPDGTFRAEGIPTDRDLWIDIVQPGSDIRLQHALGARAARDPLVVTIGPLGSFAGRVDLAGTPDEESRLELIKLDDLAPERRVSTKESGEFRVPYVSPGRYELELTRWARGGSNFDRLPISVGDTSIHWLPPKLDRLLISTPLPQEHLLLVGFQRDPLVKRLVATYPAEGPLRARGPRDTPLDLTLTSVTPGSSWVAYAKGVRAGHPVSLTVGTGRNLRVRARVPWSHLEGSHYLSARGSPGVWPLLGTAGDGYDTLVPDGTYDIVLFAPNGASRVVRRDVRPGGEPIDLGDLEPIK
ncbi:MAG: carboxypeptidase regulatory-like domain-containing protein [Planctomycetota bacterium]